MIPNLDIVGAQRRAYARLKAREIHLEVMLSGQHAREHVLARLLEEALHEYAQGLEKIADHFLKLDHDRQMLELHPLYIRKREPEMPDDPAGQQPRAGSVEK